MRWAQFRAQSQNGDTAWRVFFLSGLVGGAALLFRLIPDTAAFGMAPPLPLAMFAGLLVGIGTRVGGVRISDHRDHSFRNNVITRFG